MLAAQKPLLVAVLFLLLPACLALDAPVVSSSTHPEGEWGSLAPYFSWQAVEGAFKYCYVLDESSETTAPNEPCTEYTSVQLPTKIKSGDYFFHVKAVSSTTQSQTTTYHLKLDVESPEWVKLPPLSAKALSHESIELTWEAASDAASGVDHYEVYRHFLMNFKIRDLGTQKIAVTADTSLIDSNNIGQHETYHYKVRAIDKAGNAGPVSNEAIAQTAAKCDLDIVFSVELSDDEEQLMLSIACDDKIYRSSLKATLPDGSQHVFFEGKEPFLDWNESFSLSAVEEGYIDFGLKAEEFLGDDCGQEKRFIYDVTKTAASFVSPKYNDRVSETVPLEVLVEDKSSFKSGINSVRFFVMEGTTWTDIGTPEEDENGLYSLQWNSFGVENGQKKLKVEVVDMAGNTTEATQTLYVLNAFESVVDLNAAIQAAFAARQDALDVKWQLEGKAILSEKENRLIEEGDANLAEATTLAKLPGLENETDAKMLLAQAILSYKQSQDIVATSVYKTADFIFNREQVGILLDAAGIGGLAKQQAQLFIEKYQPGRKLEILKVVDGNSTYYKPLIVVSFSLDVNILKDSNANDLVMQIIEVVPKQFAEYASEVDSNASFTVLYDDPKLSFALTRTQYKKRSLVYALKEDLSQQQADSMIEDNVINKFVAPPIMLPAETAVSGFAISTDFLIFVAISVAVIAAVLVVLLVLKKGRGKAKGLGLPKKGAKVDLGKRPKKPARAGPKKKPEKPKWQFWKKGKPPLLGFKLPSVRKKKESPLSVFGKK